MTKNYVCHTPYLSKHTSYDLVFCCTSLKLCHFPIIFSFFKKFWFSGLCVCACVGGGGMRGGGYEGKKWPKMTKNLSHSVSQELYPIQLQFLVYICKIMISPAIFYFFNILIFLVFQKLINKCQKEILRCVPPSSHVYDFFVYYSFDYPRWQYLLLNFRNIIFPVN